MLMDVGRAFFYAPAQRELRVEPPDEDKTAGADEVGKLKKAMYGTRDAPMAWSREAEETRLALDFERGISEPCRYYYKKRGISLVVHVDDIAATGSKKELTLLSEELRKSTIWTLRLWDLTMASASREPISVVQSRGQPMGFTMEQTENT